VSRTYWAGHLAPGEVALFHFLGKSRMLCKADGTLGATPATKFADADGARAYAQQYVDAHPDRGCRLYDSTGERVEEIRGAAVPAQRYSRKDAKRDLIIGAAGFLLIPIGILIDWWVGWTLFLGMILGTKFVLVGILKLSDSIAALMERDPR
jgi:hypothetical protein